MKIGDNIKHPLLEAVSTLPSKHLEEIRGQGGAVVGFYCSYVPRELLDVPGLAPYRMRAGHTTATDQADAYLSFLNCSYTRCVLETILSDELDFIDGHVFTASCDHLRRLYDNLRYLKNPRLCHILDLPHKTHEDALDWFECELDILKNDLERSFKIKISDEDLKESIHRTNEMRKIVGRIQELRKGPNPPVSGRDMVRIMTAINSVPAYVAVKALEEIYSELTEREGIEKFRARLLVMGSHMDDAEYIGAIEEMGGLVVAETFCVGAVQFCDVVDETKPPLRALAERYLGKLSCPRMMEAYPQRYARVKETAQAYAADGIVIETMKFCDTWGVDAPVFMGDLRNDGFGVLRLEREYTRGGIGQLRTRIQAFMEMLGK